MMLTNRNFLENRQGHKARRRSETVALDVSTLPNLLTRDIAQLSRANAKQHSTHGTANSVKTGTKREFT